MKILIHSNGPMVPSGYGKQVKLLAPRLKAAGHDVAISAFYGLSGAPITWEGIPVLPAGREPYGTDVIAEHARNHGADVILTLMDFWKMGPAAAALRELRTLAWMPVDCFPLSSRDREVLIASGAQPVAMSSFGRQMLTDAGFSPLYAPHMVDRSVFKPPADRAALRRELGLDEFFLVGICAANKDSLRKGWQEQMRAFSIFAASHEEARLMVHSSIYDPGGLPLHELAQALGIAEKVIWSDQYALRAGLMGDEMMADWFGCLDVLSACSYAEGFGVPIIEAMACGTPVIGTRGSAMTELIHPISLSVSGDDWWNPVHRAWWTRPNVPEIVREYREVYRHRFTAGERQRLVDFVTLFDADKAVAEHWLPLLEAMEALDACEEEVSFEAPGMYTDEEAVARAWHGGEEV